MKTLTKDDIKVKIRDEKLSEYIEKGSSFKKVVYLDLGVKKVKLVCYSELFIPHIQKQMTYTFAENLSSYDAEIILWQQSEIDDITKVKGLFVSEDVECGELCDFVITDTTITANTSDMTKFYYGVKNLEPEEFVKEGHLFVKILNNILKTDTTTLVHGACVGLDGNGVLLCARGQKGKSTLAVLSMIEGFEYVSDDYLTLEKCGDKLFAYPIYSIITLSPRMYNELYDRLDGTRFLSNNARKDKYVINIANFHDRFRKKYPIKLCMSLEFTEDENPSIIESSPQEKGRAITQLVHSTVIQMFDMFDAELVKKIIGMVNGFKFYRINLCNDIYKNVEALKIFMKEYKDGQL
jgi:hypothetical protein